MFCKILVVLLIFQLFGIFAQSNPQDNAKHLNAVQQMEQEFEDELANYVDVLEISTCEETISQPIRPLLTSFVGN